MEKVPLLPNYLNAPSREAFAEICAGLDDLGVEYELNPRLVRGLDYYCHTAFEFTTGTLGAQATVLAGGRYDGLVSAMGGPETPGIGWAAGIERIAMMLEATPEPVRPVAIIPVSNNVEPEALRLAQELRREGYAIDLGYRGNLSKRLKRANKLGAVAAILLGEEEIAKGSVTLRDLDSGEQESVSLKTLKDRLAAFRR